MTSSTLSSSSSFIILWLRSRRLQAFSRHIDLWQGLLSLLLPSHFHHTLIHVGCRPGKRFVDSTSPFALRWYVKGVSTSSSGSRRTCQRNLSWRFLTQQTRNSVMLVMVYMTVFLFYIKHDCVARGCKGIDFSLHILWQYPGLRVIEENGHTRGVE